MSKVTATPTTSLLTRRSLFATGAASLVVPAACAIPAIAAPGLTGDALLDRYATWLHHERVAVLTARYPGVTDAGLPLLWPGEDQVAEAFVRDGGDDLHQRAAAVLASLGLER